MIGPLDTVALRIGAGRSARPRPALRVSGGRCRCRRRAFGYRMICRTPPAFAFDPRVRPQPGLACQNLAFPLLSPAGAGARPVACSLSRSPTQAGSPSGSRARSAASRSPPAPFRGSAGSVACHVEALCGHGDGRGNFCPDHCRRSRKRRRGGALSTGAESGPEDDVRYQARKRQRRPQTTEAPLHRCSGASQRTGSEGSDAAATDHGVDVTAD